MKKAIWMYILRPFIRKHTRNTDKIVLFNDAAFPGPNLIKLLKSRGLHISLIQEGIRFPLPNEVERAKYGGSNIDVIYSWGKKSADFFDKRSHAQVRIVEAGCPRLDQLSVDGYIGEINRLKAQNDFSIKNWIICSNPVDDQGYMSEASKWELIIKLIGRITGILQEHGIKLWIKLHPGEKEQNLLSYLEKHGLTENIQLIKGNIFAILSQMDLVIVLASTVGLEALCLKKRIAVVKLPGYDYQFDYVAERAGVGIDVSAKDVEKTIRELANSEWNGKLEEEYLDKHLSHRGYSAAFIAQDLL